MAENEIHGSGSDIGEVQKLFDDIPTSRKPGLAIDTLLEKMIEYDREEGSILKLALSEEDIAAVLPAVNAGEIVKELIEREIKLNIDKTSVLRNSDGQEMTIGEVIDAIEERKTAADIRIAGERFRELSESGDSDVRTGKSGKVENVSDRIAERLSAGVLSDDMSIRKFGNDTTEATEYIIALNRSDVVVGSHKVPESDAQLQVREEKLVDNLQTVFGDKAEIKLREGGGVELETNDNNVTAVMDKVLKHHRTSERINEEGRY